MKYNSFRYIYPCRPANAIPPDVLNGWDNNTMLGQLKFNGSNTVIFTNGETLMIMGRHNQILSNFNINRNEIIDNLYKPLNINNNWIVINGETLNKSKRDENGNIFNNKFIVFDILVYNSEYLVGKTFEERVNILDEIYGKRNSNKEYLWGISDNIYRVKSYDGDFENIFNNYTKIDLIEGLVLKKKSARLELSSGEKNNWRSQVKCRKTTKNYKF